MNEDLVIGYYQDISNLQPFSNLSKEAEQLGIKLWKNCSLPISVAQNLLDRANHLRNTEHDSEYFRTLEPKRKISLKPTQIPLQKEKEKTSMKLNISRTSLITSLTSYITFTIKANTDALAAYNEAKTPIVDFVNNNKELMAKMSDVSVEEITPKMVETKVNTLLPLFGIPSVKPFPKDLSTVQSMVAKLNLSTDESIELQDSDPILSFLNVS